MLEELQGRANAAQAALARAEAAQTATLEPERKPRSSLGPAAQPRLPIIERGFQLDAADHTCPSCGGQPPTSVPP